jgi:hypothetical protein
MLAYSLSILEPDTKSQHKERNPKGDSNNARSAKSTRVNRFHGTVFLENADSRGDEPDGSAGGLRCRYVAESRAGGADGEPENGAKPAPG